MENTRKKNKEKIQFIIYHIHLNLCKINRNIMITNLTKQNKITYLIERMLNYNYK